MRHLIPLLFFLISGQTIVAAADYQARPNILFISLDALENGPNKDNTIVALWSDHGWHLGEKQHWQKYTAWRAVTRVPLMIKVPKSIAPGLPDGTKAGSICKKPVNLLDLFPTLTELSGLPKKSDNDGISLVPLLKNPEAEWKHVSLTHLGEPGSYGLSAENWRYIHYSNSDEELYNITNDPYEWDNLANKSEHSDKLTKLRALAPKEFAALVEPKTQSLTSLKWHPTGKEPTPPSKPDGDTFKVTFVNTRESPVELFWIDRKGKPKSYGIISAGKKRQQQTRPGAVWQITILDGGKALGYFEIGDRPAQAVVPEA